MNRSAILALAAALLLVHAGGAIAGPVNCAADVACNPGYNPVSPAPTTTTETCTPKCDGSTCDASITNGDRALTCASCCVVATCGNYDGAGTDFPCDSDSFYTGPGVDGLSPSQTTCCTAKTCAVTTTAGATYACTGDGLTRDTTKNSANFPSDAVCCKPVSGTGSYTCDNTACDATKGYYPVPLSSNSHPSKTNTCSKCRTVALDGFCDPFGKNAAGGDNTVDDTCQECCFQRTCTNFDGEGNGFCPYGYVNKANTPVQAGATAFDTCCIATTDNSFPAAKSTIVGGVQAVSGESNWGFDEETQTVPYVSNKGRYTGMCFKISANYECDSAGNSDAECCKPGTKPAYLQFKLPVSYALTASGDRYSAFKKIERCRLSYGRTTARTVNKLKWKFTNQDATGAAGQGNTDARYATIPLNFGLNREVSLCLFTADIKKDMDCSFENICGLKATDVNYIGADVPGATTNTDLRTALGCEMRLIGAAKTRVGNTVTSKCVGTTYTVYDYTSFSDFSGGGAKVGSFNGFHLVQLNGTSIL